MKFWITLSLAAALSCSVMASQGQFETTKLQISDSVHP